MADGIMEDCATPGWGKSRKTWQCWESLKR